jgi:phytoene synthase
VDRAFARIVARHAIPGPPRALLEGLAWDARAAARNLPDLSPTPPRRGHVGAMMSLLMGVRCPDALARATDYRAPPCS